MKTNWDEVSKAIEKEDFFHRYVINAECLKLANKIKNKTVADLGCGNGILIRKLMKEGAKKGFAVDIGEELLNIAKKNNVDRKVTFLKNDVTEHIDINNESCDIVTQIMLLHTLPELEGLVKETYRILRNGGSLIVCIPHPIAIHKNRYISLQNFDVDNYIEPQNVQFLWNRTDSKIPMQFHSRTLSSIINLYIKNNFTLTVMTEPVVPPIENVSGKIIYSKVKGLNIEEEYKKMRSIPNFLFLKFKK